MKDIFGGCIASAGTYFFPSIGFLAFIMFQKLEGFNILPPKAAIHAYIGIAIFPLIVIKICIVRFYNKFYKSLPVYGVIIVIAVFLQVPLYAGLYIISAIKSQYVSLSDKGRLVRVNVNMGRKIVQQKCATCHSLERVYAYAKSEADWWDYLARMRTKDPAFMNDQEALNALGYLVKNAMAFSRRRLKGGRSGLAEVLRPMTEFPFRNGMLGGTRELLGRSGFSHCAGGLIAYNAEGILHITIRKQ